MMCVQYNGRCSVHLGRFRTSRGYHDEYIGDVQYIRGYHEYIGGRGDIMSTSEDVQEHWRFQ